MGIEFPARTEEQRKSVGEFIEFLNWPAPAPLRNWKLLLVLSSRMQST